MDHREQEEEGLQFAQFNTQKAEFVFLEAMEEKVNNQHEPTLNEAFTKISAPLNENANFKIDATMLNFLPSFNG